MTKQKIAIIGSGNIGTDLMIKVLRHGKNLEMGAMVGIDPESEGLARARRLGVVAIDNGIEGLLALPNLDEIAFVFDATSAGAHKRHDELLRPHGIRVIDLTPAAIGPYVVPAVNLGEFPSATNINMVTCGGQATIPMVAAVSQVVKVIYGEIVASISSKSAGPGTRANIDEFTETTARAIEKVGGAQYGKAIIVLNPAEPPLVMRDTVLCLSMEADEKAIEASVLRMLKKVQAYVPGYRLKQNVQFDKLHFEEPQSLGSGQQLQPGTYLKTTVFLEVEGAGHYLPTYAGNLDIMTSAALACAEELSSKTVADSRAHRSQNSMQQVNS